MLLSFRVEYVKKNGLGSRLINPLYSISENIGV